MTAYLEVPETGLAIWLAGDSAYKAGGKPAFCSHAPPAKTNRTRWLNLAIERQSESDTGKPRQNLFCFDKAPCLMGGWVGQIRGLWKFF